MHGFSTGGRNVHDENRVGVHCVPVKETVGERTEGNTYGAGSYRPLETGLATAMYTKLFQSTRDRADGVRVSVSKI